MTALGNSHNTGEIITPSAAWRLALAALLGGWIVVFAVYYGTSASLVRTWVSSDLYSHGFFIIPVAGYLLWRRRGHLRVMPIRPSIWGLVGIALSAVTWLTGEATATNTLAHLGLIGMLQSVFFTVFGPAISQRSLYPLGYLLLAVPFGAGLIEPLQQLTAAGTVQLIRLTGIAIHLDGFMLVIPAGRFHIAEACAGVRFLLSTFALAWLAADILYTSPWRRLAFLTLAVAVPLAANTLRAYLILVIASVSGSGASSAFDHVTYGLVFLGFVMFLLLLIGLTFRDRGGAALADVPEPITDAAQPSTSRLGILLALSLSIAALPALLIDKAKAFPALGFKPALVAPSVALPWKSAPDARQSWRPSVSGPDAEIQRAYLMDEARVDLYIGYFAQERQGAEAVNEETDWAGRGPWRVLGMAEAVLSIDGRSIDAPCIQIASGHERRLVCYWYWIAQTMTANPYLAKLLRAWAWLSGDLQSASVIAVATSYDERPDAAVETLQSFLGATEPLNPLLVRAAQPE